MMSEVTYGVLFNTKIVVTKLRANFRGNTLSESGVMRNVREKYFGTISILN